MVTEEESQKLYEGKFFYKVVKSKSEEITLFGPLDDIYYARLIGNKESNLKIKFIQVVDGQAVAAFTEEEILVTDHKL